MSHSPMLTAEELLQLHVSDKRAELVRGNAVIREPAGFRHGEIAARLTLLIGSHVHANRLGQVVAATTGFTLAREPDTVRAPDVAFVSRQRLPRPTPIGFAELAPDLVVEVLSSGSRPDDILARVADWRDAGSRLVWIVDPDRREVRVHRADGSTTLLGEIAMLQGEDVLPGFALAVAEIF